MAHAWTTQRILTAVAQYDELQPSVLAAEGTDSPRWPDVDPTRPNAAHADAAPLLDAAGILYLPAHTISFMVQAATAAIRSRQTPWAQSGDDGWIQGALDTQMHGCQIVGAGSSRGRFAFRAARSLTKTSEGVIKEWQPARGKQRTRRCRFSSSVPSTVRASRLPGAGRPATFP